MTPKNNKVSKERYLSAEELEIVPIFIDNFSHILIRAQSFDFTGTYHPFLKIISTIKDCLIIKIFKENC